MQEDLARQEEEIRREADELLEGKGLRALQSKHGTVHVTGSFNGLDLHLKNLTALEENQQGDSSRGRLLLPFDRQDPEAALFPVTYRPLRNGEEVRITLSPQGNRLALGGLCGYIRGR